MQGKILVGVFMAVGVTAGVSRLDRTMNYIPTEGIVTSAEYDCSVENSKSKLEVKATGELAWMDCEMAPIAAAEFGYKTSDINKRIKFKYKFKSPVDGSMQVDDYESTGKEVAYKTGTKFEVFAHKENPKKSRIN